MIDEKRTRVDKESIIETIYAAIDELNEQLPREERLEKSPQTALHGESGSLDSLDVVNLIVLTEQALVERLGVSISLADEGAFAPNENPFTDVRSLSEFIEEVINRK